MGMLPTKMDANAMHEAKVFVDGEIQGSRIVVFEKKYCAYCEMAKEALNGVGATFKSVDVEKRMDQCAIIDYLRAITCASAFPWVFIDGKFIGGGKETVKLQKSGELAKMVNTTF